MLSALSVTDLHGGVVRGTLLQKYGIDRRMRADAVHAGALIRVRTGVFAGPNADTTVVEAAAHGGALTCAHALRLYGVWALDPGGPVHVWLGAKGRTHHETCECVAHFDAGHAGVGLAPLEEVLIHVYRCGGDEAFFAAVESALVQQKITGAALRRIRRRLPARAHWLIDLARSDADSGLESLLRLRLHLHGISLDCQVTIPSVGRVDFVLDGSLILEADEKGNHDGPAHRHRDLVRDAAASALGYETLRFDYAQIVHAWPSVETAVLAAIVRLRARH